MGNYIWGNFRYYHSDCPNNYWRKVISKRKYPNIQPIKTNNNEENKEYRLKKKDKRWFLLLADHVRIKEPDDPQRSDVANLIVLRYHELLMGDV